IDAALDVAKVLFVFRGEVYGVDSIENRALIVVPHASAAIGTTSQYHSRDLPGNRDLLQPPRRGCEQERENKGECDLHRFDRRSSNASCRLNGIVAAPSQPKVNCS